MSAESVTLLATPTATPVMLQLAQSTCEYVECQRSTFAVWFVIVRETKY